MLIVIFRYRNHGVDLLPRVHLEQIDNRNPPGGSRSLRNFVGVQLVNPSQIRKEHQLRMGRRHKNILDIIVLDRGHSLDSLPAAVLGFEIIDRHPLYITEIRHSDHRILVRNQILHSKIRLIITDGGSSLIAVLIRNNVDLFPDYAKQQLFIRQNRLKPFDLLL